MGFLSLVALIGVAYAATPIPQPNDLISAQTTIVYFDDGKTEIGRFGEQNRIIVAAGPGARPRAEGGARRRGPLVLREQAASRRPASRAPSGPTSAAAPPRAARRSPSSTRRTPTSSSERTYSRKFKEFFIAVKLDRRDDKDKILEDYLNTIYFGRGAYGIQTAAQTYFGKDAKDLTVAEGAVLASVIRSPANYDPVDDAERLQGRFDYVLDGMVTKGWLDAGERAGLQVPKLADPKKPKGGTDYYLMDTVRRELKAHGFTDQDIDLGGLRVTSTFDRRSQRAAVRAVRQERPRENARNVHIGLSAVQPGTGAVVAMYGGSEAGQLNEATQARVQPGSAFKAFTLSAALRDDISLKSRFWGNSPFDVPGTDKEVNNEFDNDYGTSVDLVTATEDSINTAFVDLSIEMGTRKVVEAAIDAGIPEDTPGLTANAVTTLGTASVRNIDMATAYATFAAQGEAAPWYTVQEVKGANGGTRYQAKPKTTRAFDEDVMADLSYALQQVVENGTGAEAQSLGRPAAGKTGTAALRPDTTTSAWFVGYTPQLAAAVDFYKGTGRADLDGVGGLPTFFGGEYPARIWTAFMTAAMQNKEVKDFPPRANVGEAVNPQPTFTPSPSETPTETPTTETPTPTETVTVVPPTDTVPTTPPPAESPPGTIVISPSLEPPDNGAAGRRGRWRLTGDHARRHRPTVG